jgi:biopolymer transport protein ExbD
VKRSRKSRAERASYAMSPMRIIPFVNLAFLLILFFILAVRFQSLEGVLEAQLPRFGPPEQVSSTIKDLSPVKIRLADEEEALAVYLENRMVESFEELLDLLRSLPKEVQLVIEPDPTIRYKDVVAAYNTCVKAERTKIAFSVPPK